jgi:HemY protein
MAQNPTQHVFKLLAALERREAPKPGQDQASSNWLQRATEAPPDPRWLCNSCGGSHAIWNATCAHCHAFNSIEWQTPGASRRHSPSLLTAS